MLKNEKEVKEDNINKDILEFINVKTNHLDKFKKINTVYTDDFDIIHVFKGNFFILELFEVDYSICITSLDLDEEYYVGLLDDFDISKIQQ